jgi:KUP system potassium uptake protein
VEGLEVATNVFNPYIVPIAVVVLLGLFGVQRFGTGKMGSIFGPVMLLWFIVLATLGVKGILMAPRAYLGRPSHASEKELALKRLSAASLGVLSRLLGRGVYADMGISGFRPIGVPGFSRCFRAAAELPWPGSIIAD